MGGDDFHVAAGFDEGANLGGGHIDGNVGLDAPGFGAVAAMEAFAVGQVIILRGELELGLALGIADVHDVLDAALAEAAMADDQAAVEILHGSGENFRKSNGKWALADDDAKVLRKRHDLQGPIDDAFLDSFVMVRPTGAPLNETVGKWTKSEMDRAIHQWRGLFRGDAPVKDDTAISDADLANSNLVLWGDPQSNKVLARVMEKLPVQWTAGAITLGARTFPAATSAPVMIYPNPLNPKKYIVINSGFTFRESANGSNSWQVAELPDYAVVDLTTPPNSRWPGRIAAAGFFGEKWELLATDGK